MSGSKEAQDEHDSRQLAHNSFNPRLSWDDRRGRLSLRLFLAFCTESNYSDACDSVRGLCATGGCKVMKDFVVEAAVAGLTTFPTVCL